MQTDYSRYEMSRTQRLLFYIAFLVCALLAAELFYRNMLLSVILLPFARRVRREVSDYLAERRRRKLLMEFKDMLFMTATSIGAGRSLKDAIHEAIPGIEGIYGATSCLVPEMKDMYQRMSGGNEKDTDVLFDFAVRTGLEDVIDFVTIYATCKETGASLILALNRAASVIIDKMTIEGEVREIVKRKQSEGLVIFAMPVIVLLFLNLTASDYISPLYDTAAGRIIMTVVLISDGFIYTLIRRIMKVEV